MPFVDNENQTLEEPSVTAEVRDRAYSIYMRAGLPGGRLNYFEGDVLTNFKLEHSGMVSVMLRNK